MKKNIFISCMSLLFVAKSLSAQMAEILTLENCYQLAENNYPLIAQKGIIESITDEAIKKINTYWQPQVYLNAQATYQSAVTHVPIEIPNFEIPELSKDQYKATVDVSQLIYDGGIAHQQKTLQQNNSAVEIQKTEVEIYKLHEKINQLFFSILLAEKNTDLIKNLKSDLIIQKKKIDAGLQYGVASQNNADILEAELLKADEKMIEVKAAKTSAVQMLSILIGQKINSDTQFTEPEISISITDTINSRPELQLFSLQQNYAQQQMDFANAATLPKLSLFAQGGYGKPGLNFLEDEFKLYYVAGIKLSYPIWTGNTKKEDAAIFGLNEQSIEIQKQLFTLNTNMLIEQQTSEIQKLNLLLEKDNAIIALKTKIKNTATAQLDNGVLSANDYIMYLNDETEAKINLATHQIQLLTAQINYLTTLGKIN